MTRLRGLAGPLCLWLLVMVALGLMVVRSQAQERDALVDRFQSRADAGSSVVETYVDDVFMAERRLVREVSRETWKPADFGANTDLLGIPSAVLLDRDGQVVAQAPEVTEGPRTDLASTYPHLQAALEGSSAVSDVVASMVDGEPVVGFALPVMTSDQITVLSTEFDLTGGALAAYIARQPVAGTNAVLLDSTGDVIASSGGTAMAQRMFSTFRDSDQGPVEAGDRVLAAQAVQGTEWTYVVDAPRAALLAPGAENDLNEWALLFAAAIASLAGLVIAQRARADRSKARLEKEQLDQRLRNTVENAPVGMTLVDLDHRFVEPNKRLCQMLGYSADELTNLSFHDVTHADDQTLDLALLDQLVAGEIDSYELEKRYVQQDGSVLWGRLAVSVLRDESGGLAYFVSQIEDVTEVRKARYDLQHRALYDPLTGLANRSLLMDRLTVSLGNDRNQVNVGVGFCDLDHFKSINDTHGHQVGDEVLKEVARRLQESVRAEDTVARLGGDEFVIVLHDVASLDEANGVLERASRAIQEPILVDGLVLRTSLSVGLAVAAHGDDPDVLLRDADAAMYVAKHGGRGRIETAPLPSSFQAASSF
ncbi:diguanylate cyclase domain-containing protein [Nocardioides sp.]|uniref:diguanylate cyclase domain-containing protein n=1 Tax=Nocardioides sp. TaxID=35761 RepID=UPI002C9EDF4D|nr:diguanylate cyclase [Nocardioides sp.]HXH78083.1 diguanylate cyclase [Nocardioides sp.]